MTTPERLRKRQIRNDWYIVILAVLLLAAFIYFRGQDNAQERCFNNYFQAQADTSKVRSKLVERESQATRDLLLRGTTAESREEFQKIRALYVKRIKAIDQAREDNPIPPFPEGICR